MAGTGTQKYPGASTAYFYQNRFGGDVMEVNVVVLHTTEGRTLPDYGGGASAPNLTAVPDFAARKLRWFQHFDIDRSSRALVNLSGGVATNTLNVVQVELVGTCDPHTHAAWAGVEHIYWPEAPDWALAELAVFLKWLNAEHGVPLVGPSKWPAYPTSYANGGGQRMTFDQWNGFEGVCGHMHVPENTHGDPGAIDFNRLIALAKGQTVPEEDDMPTAADVWKADVINAAAPPYNNSDYDTNKTWTASYALSSAVLTGRKVEAKVDALAAKVDALAVGGVDLDALAVKVADLLAARLAN